MFKNIDVSVDPVNVKGCHWVKTYGSEKVIINFSRRKDASKIRAVKKAEG